MTHIPTKEIGTQSGAEPLQGLKGIRGTIPPRLDGNKYQGPHPFNGEKRKQRQRVLRVLVINHPVNADLLLKEI